MQRNGKELNGLLPVTPHTCYRNEPEAKAFIARQKRAPVGQEPDQRLYWDAAYNGFNQFYLDGLTVDARNAAKRAKVLAVKGKPVPIKYNNISTAAVGGAPVVMAYISTHAIAGCTSTCPRTGAKGGLQGSLDDFECWYDTIPLDHQRQILDFDYYNHKKGIEKLKPGYKQRPFDYKNFKVPISSACQCSVSGRPSLSHSHTSGKRIASAAHCLRKSRLRFATYRCSAPHTSTPTQSPCASCTTMSMLKSAPLMNMPVSCARPFSPFTDISGSSLTMPASGYADTIISHTSATPLSAPALCTGHLRRRCCPAHAYMCTAHPALSHCGLYGCPSLSKTYCSRTLACRCLRVALSTILSLGLCRSSSC